MPFHRSLSTLAVLAACAAPLLGQGYPNLVVFGDSLSDNGNFYAQTSMPGAPYWQGRFSNGMVWVEQLANHVGLSAAAIDDRAVGFATTGDVLQLQVLPYVGAASGVDPNALHVYWAGANDLFPVIAGTAAPGPAITAAMQNTAAALLALVAGGAQHILVVDLADLSLVPEIAGLHDPAISAAVRGLAQAYNDALALTLQSLEVATGVDFVELSAFALTGALAEDPLEGGFRVVDTAAMSPEASVAPHIEHFLFWDHVHPTTLAHSFIAGAAFERLGGLWGDVDGNGRRDALDIAAQAQVLGPCQPGCRADMNGDGIVDADDRRLLHFAIR